MLDINFKELFEVEGLSLDIDHESDMNDVELYGIHPFVAPMHIKGTIENRAGVVSVDADVTVRIETECDRCAVPVAKTLTIKMDHIFVPESYDTTNDEYIVVPDSHYDLDILATEDVLLSLPTKILCSENCKGICSRCGKNLNEGPCDCKKEVDPRLSSLLDLLSDED